METEGEAAKVPDGKRNMARRRERRKGSSHSR